MIYRTHIATASPPPPVELWEEFNTTMAPRYIAGSVAEHEHPSTPAPESITVHVCDDRGRVTVWRVESRVIVEWEAREVGA
jgi:hypothetical protein